MLSVGNIKQENAAEGFILSQQETVFQTGQHKLGRQQFTNDSKQGKKKKTHTNLFNSETVFYLIMELLFTKCGIETEALCSPVTLIHFLPTQSQLSY